ncbi:hypothetical protein BJX96DRAFT_148094, partial [Aspergillus floccosus]
MISACHRKEQARETWVRLPVGETFFLIYCSLPLHVFAENQRSQNFRGPSFSVAYRWPCLL